MNDQNNINEIYSNFCTELTNEMDDHLHYLSNKKGNGICRIKRKPFWNNNLTMLWKEMKNKEHIFVKQRGSTYEKHVKKEAFLYCRRMFDRTLRQTEIISPKNVRCY